MNSVLLAIGVMLTLSLVRINVVLALFVGAITGGLSGGLGLNGALSAFTDGMKDGVNIAVSYGMLGGFAVAIAASGTPQWLTDKIILKISTTTNESRITFSLIASTCLMAIASQNLVPVHIAFIPILIPPLINLFNSLKIDRRVIACSLSFGLIATYMLIPVGFGNIYLKQILANNLNNNGLNIDPGLMPLAMSLPVLGLFVGLLIAVFWSYRKPRHYRVDEPTLADDSNQNKKRQKTMGMQSALITILAITLTLWTQIVYDSMILAAAIGFMIMMIGGVVHWRDSDNLFTKGMQMMAQCGFIMITAAGFAEVLRTTGEISSLVSTIEHLVFGSKALAAFLMLLVGLLITLGIGSSFSTIPIIATLFVPLALSLGFSPLATAVLVGASGGLGDAGSPASDSTIGATAGLNIDGQHDHIRDTVIPTFIHYNIPMLIFAWVGAMIF